MKYLLKLISTVVLCWSFHASAFSLPAIKGKLTNFTLFNNSQIFLDISMKCRGVFDYCGTERVLVQLNEDGYFDIPKMSHLSLKPFHYYQFSYTLIVEDQVSGEKLVIDSTQTSQTISSQCNSRQLSGKDYSKCYRAALIKELESGLSLYYRPDVDMALETNDGTDVNRFIESRLMSRLIYDITLTHDKFKYDLTPQFTNFIKDKNHLVKGSLFVVPGKFSEDKAWNVEVKIYQHGQDLKQFYNVNEKMRIGEINTYLENPVLQIEY